MPSLELTGRAIVLDWQGRSMIRLRVQPPRIGGSDDADPADALFTSALTASRAAGELSVAHGWPIVAAFA
ncbi:hypothetical protein [Sphingobium sp. KCTC 72723]|uniref:hypothetical protein n=1 Tax=Sphingobium sp. KCTC 72723 TaxID=2733867 RepID=UPI00165D89C6|nr:hypothetical protein [Sphingobium sp. KCTC 72723]